MPRHKEHLEIRKKFSRGGGELRTAHALPQDYVGDQQTKLGPRPQQLERRRRVGSLDDRVSKAGHTVLQRRDGRYLDDGAQHVIAGSGRAEPTDGDFASRAAGDLELGGAA